MPIVLLRIDDRYIHGQVTVGWTRAYGVNEIWVVDDFIASNPMMKQLQIALAPPGTKVSVLTVKEAIEKIKSGNYDKRNKIMIIVAKPKDCLKIFKEAGKILDWINVGQSAWKQGKVLVVKNFAVGPEDVEAFKELAKMGVELRYQMLPEDRPQNFYKLLKAKGLVKE
jgi:fructose-specific PTS system IIB component